MKRIESVKLSGLNGERVDVVTFARWTKEIAGIKFPFALHLLPSFKVGLPNKLWISEVGTGFNTLVVVKHPVSGQHMTDVMADKLGQSYVVRLAKSALHNTLKRYGDSAFVDGLVRAEMLLAKQQRQLERETQRFDCEACEDTRMQAESGPEGELLAVACKKCADRPVPLKEGQEEERLSHNILEGHELKPAECDTCCDSKVVSTTDTDHEGNHIEAECPVCVTKSAGLKSGGVGFRFDMEAVEAQAEDPVEEIAAAKAAGKCGECYACYGGYHEQCKGKDFDWSKEVDEALDDAEVMSQNMAKYGTIDAPAIHLPETTVADMQILIELHKRRSSLQERADQHGTMTGDTTEQEYESLTEELADIDKQIHDLENPPCPK